MSERYLGQIILVGFNYPPVGWAFCHGQLLPIAKYGTLFALIGTTYGGDGETTFALPDLRGRIPVGPGQGPGVPNCFIGETGGAGTMTLTAPAAHAHAGSSSASTANAAMSANAAGVSGPVTVAAAGQNQPHGNMQPYLILNFCISLTGVFPNQPC